MKLAATALTAIGLVICLAETSGQAGIELTTLASFDGTNGAYPLMLVESSDGSFCGTAAYGGIGFNGTEGGNGVIFKITMDGALSTSVKFDDGRSYPTFMLQTSSQNYYGSLLFAGPGNSSGALFKLNPDASLAEFDPVSFNRTNGESPIGLVEDRVGNLYGVTQFGGSGIGWGFGTVFKIDTNSVFSTVAQFSGTNGASPVSLILGADGNFYGVTQEGGTNNLGVLFKMTPDGTLSALYSFQGTDGARPFWLVQGTDGYFYGTTISGGIGHGSLFKVTTNGTLVWSFPFSGTNGSQPNVIMQGVDGNFYGTTDRGGDSFNEAPYGGYGTVFRITSEGDFTSMVSFEGTNGTEPFFILTGTDGNLYGTTWGGGENSLGTVFRLSIPMSPVFQKTIQANGSLAMTWSAVAGQTYQLQYTTNLTSATWNDLGTEVVATNGVMSATDSIGPDARRLYRVVLLP